VASVAIGKVKKWITEQSFGFVVLADGRDVFVHKDKLPGGLEELDRGDLIRVEFAERPDGKLRATRIELV
jgi:cold shock CspA family protein